MSDKKTKIVRIEDWALVPRSHYPGDLCLHGVIFGHPKHDDGKQVRTSVIVGKVGKFIQTAGGSLYELGKVRKEYEQKFPDAFNRIMKCLPEVDSNAPTSFIMADFIGEPKKKASSKVKRKSRKGKNAD